MFFRLLQILARETWFHYIFWGYTELATQIYRHPQTLHSYAHLQRDTHAHMAIIQRGVTEIVGVYYKYSCGSSAASGAGKITCLHTHAHTRSHLRTWWSVKYRAQFRMPMQLSIRVGNNSCEESLGVCCRIIQSELAFFKFEKPGWMPQHEYLVQFKPKQALFTPMLHKKLARTGCWPVHVVPVLCFFYFKWKLLNVWCW